MKILVLSNMYPSKESKTYGIFVKNQVEALKERGHDVSVIAITSIKKGKWATLKKYLFFYFKQWLNILTTGKDYDVIHVHYVFPTGLFVPLFKKITKAKIVVTAHGGDIDQMIHTHDFSRGRTEKILHIADHIIAVGERLKTDMIHHFKIPENKIQVSSMGVNLSVFHPVDKDEARHTVNMPANQKALVFVGNIIKKKGVLELLCALSDQPSIHLYLIGETKDKRFYEDIKQQYLDQSAHFHYVGPVDQTELKYWFSAADAFVLPSHIEGLGLVAVEAMACQTPVIASDVGGLHYLLQDNTGILVTPEDSDALKEAIVSFFNQNDHSLYIQNGLERVKQHNAEKIIDDLLQLYQDRKLV